MIRAYPSSALLAGALATIAWTGRARAAGFVDYLRSYRLGVEYASSGGSIDVTYNAKSDVTLDPGRCKNKGGGAYQCVASLPIYPSPSIGFHAEQPLQRQGFWHFDYDFAFALRSFRTKDRHYDDDGDVAPPGSLSPPIKRLQLNLYGANLDSYLEFGITPGGWWPDLIFDTGIGLQPMYGSLKVDDTVLNGRFFLNSLLYGEADLNVFHFGECGLVYLYDMVESGAANLGGLAVDGASGFQFEFVRFTVGLAVTTNFP